jgi:hypothetical protein
MSVLDKTLDTYEAARNHPVGQIGSMAASFVPGATVPMGVADTVNDLHKGRIGSAIGNAALTAAGAVPGGRLLGQGLGRAGKWLHEAVRGGSTVGQQMGGMAIRTGTQMAGGAVDQANELARPAVQKQMQDQQRDMSDFRDWQAQRYGQPKQAAQTETGSWEIPLTTPPRPTRDVPSTNDVGRRALALGKKVLPYAATAAAGAHVLRPLLEGDTGDAAAGILTGAGGLAGGGVGMVGGSMAGSVLAKMLAKKLGKGFDPHTAGWGGALAGGMGGGLLGYTMGSDAMRSLTRNALMPYGMGNYGRYKYSAFLAKVAAADEIVGRQAIGGQADVHGPMLPGTGKVVNEAVVSPFRQQAAMTAGDVRGLAAHAGTVATDAAKGFYGATADAAKGLYGKLPVGAQSGIHKTMAFAGRNKTPLALGGMAALGLGAYLSGKGKRDDEDAQALAAMKQGAAETTVTPNEVGAYKKWRGHKVENETVLRNRGQESVVDSPNRFNDFFNPRQRAYHAWGDVKDMGRGVADFAKRVVRKVDEVPVTSGQVIGGGVANLGGLISLGGKGLEGVGQWMHDNPRKTYGGALGAAGLYRLGKYYAQRNAKPGEEELAQAQDAMKQDAAKTAGVFAGMGRRVDKAVGATGRAIKKHPYAAGGMAAAGGLAAGVAGGVGYGLGRRHAGNDNDSDDGQPKAAALVDRIAILKRLYS